LNGNENNLAVTYPAPVTAAFSTNILSAAMYRNGSNVSSENNTPVTLSAGYYNYTVINPGNQNYSLSSKTFFAAVQQNTSTCSLTINPASPQTYGTAINASCSCTNPEASANLYRNGSSINSENNQLVALAAGSYNYVCNVSSTQNYTAASNSTVYIINKAAHTVHLEINGTESDRSFVYPAQTNVTGYLEINQAAGSAQLLRNGSAAASGSPASEAAVLGAGLYNYTYFYPASQNYTAQSITRFLQINKSATALNLTISPALVVINNTQTNVSCFADNPEVNVNLYRNNTPVSNPDVQTLASGDYNYTCNTTGSQNYTAASESNILTVLAKNPSSCSLNIIPSSPSAYGTAITATCSCSNPEASANLYRNGTNVTNENNTAVVLAAGNYNYVCNVSETANYSSAVNSTTYTINKAASACSLNFNPASPQTYGTAVNASCSCTNPESAAMLHRNGSDVTAENNNAVVLAAGSYFFNCTASTSQNYSYAENTSTYTINKAPSEVNLLLNEIDNNITAYIGDAVNHTVQLITPAAGYVELYRNNNLILSGNAPITNISVYNNVSITNITAVYNATQNYTSSFETHFINATDNESPAILSTIIDPYDPALGNDVSLNAIATDNGVIDSMSANISLPNGTIITALLPANYTTALTGRHNVTFITNDTANNIAAEEDYFIVGDIPVIAQFNVMNANLTGILTNLTIYFTGTEKQIELLAFTGNAVDNNTNILYDLEFLALAGDITVRLNNVNLSLDDNKTLGIDKNNAAPEFLVTYGINSTYSFTNSVVTTSYAGTGYTNEDNLAVYKCDNWNFTARQCLSSWTQIAAVQDKAADTFNFTAASFSAFSIKQEIAPPAPPAGGGVRKPAACYEDWQCTKWSVCSTGGLQIRECTDTGTCQHGTRVETRACIFRGTCSDNIKNQDETDIDCGGSICLPCPEGKTCLTDNDCINKCSPETKICYKPSKPIVTESPSIKVLTLFEGVWRQITQNIKFLAALSITLILIIIIYADYIKGKIAKINILENVAKKKAYGKITTKEYIKNILMMHKKAVIELLTKYRKIYIKRITRNIKAVKKKR
jgi:hypothetical protein